MHVTRVSLFFGVLHFFTFFALKAKEFFKFTKYYLHNYYGFVIAIALFADCSLFLMFWVFCCYDIRLRLSAGSATVQM